MAATPIVSRLGLALVGATLSLLAAGAPAQPSFGEPIGIDDPSGRALAPLHAALRAAQRGDGRARVMVWGASHVASDQFTGLLREAWQRRFGDAGPGFVVPARPFTLYAHRQARISERGRWRIERVLGRRRTPGRYGPAGLALDGPRGARALVELAPELDGLDRAIVFREGGAIEARPGAARVSLAPGHAPAVVPMGGARRIELVAREPVRLYGVSLERARPGVIVDAMGIPGARIRDRQPWDDAALAEQLAALAPSLVVLAYGTNESGMTGRSMRRYRAEVIDAVTRARRLAPDAGCLLIGPSDWPLRDDAGGWRARARTAEVIAAQRDVAHRHGCGFFDLVAFQGGPVSMPRWVRAGLALEDHVHFTDEGHAVLARVLSRALLEGLAGSPRERASPP